MSLNQPPHEATPRSTAHPFPKPPFIIGITGNVDPDGYSSDRAACDSNEQMEQLKKKITNILTWVSTRDQRLDPTTGELVPAKKKHASKSHDQDPWLSLGLENTPILVLSSLAPGADTIVAETVLEYAKTHSEVSVTLSAPLPFPENIYEKSSTFEENHDTTVARYREILNGIRAQPNPGSIFCVALDNDLMPPRKDADEVAEHDLTADDPTYGLPRRHLRYRAAGEYIAVHSDLLLSIYDEAHDLLPKKKSGNWINPTKSQKRPHCQHLRGR